MTSDDVVQSVESERSPLAAAMLQAVLPPLPLGYLYAGELRRSLLPTGLMVGGSVVFVLEVTELVDWTDEDKSSALLYVGLGAMMAGYVYGIIDAADAARDHNDRLKRGAPSVALMPTPHGVTLLAHLECGGFGKAATR